MWNFLDTRSVVEVMTLVFTFLIGFLIVVGAAAVIVAEIFNPEVDTLRSSMRSYRSSRRSSVRC